MIPNLTVYLPEGETDIRFQKLIKNVLFESQINYNFIEGDIAAFLRYKYYARTFTYRIGVFDTVEFDSVDEFSQDFNRTRGALLLLEMPKDFHNRYFLLAQVDRLTFKREGFQFDDNTTNTYIKAAYQFGTPSDERSNAIVGEARARIRSLFTPLKEIGPRGFGLSVAATTGFDFAGGDYRYVKTEIEVLKALQVTKKQRLIARLHVGSFPYKTVVEGRDPEQQDYLYSIPHYELFKLGGRDQLKGVDGSLRGLHQVQLTGEHYIPVFTDRDAKFLTLRWQDLWAVLYGGTGNIGYTVSEVSELSEWAIDMGVGMEASFWFRSHQFYVMMLAAKAINSSRGGKLYFSVKSIH